MEIKELKLKVLELYRDVSRYYVTHPKDKFMEGAVFAYREVLQRMGYKYQALLELETFVCEEIERLRKEDLK